MSTETGGPVPPKEQRDFKMEKSLPRDLEGFLASPDYFVLRPARSLTQTHKGDVSHALLENGVVQPIPNPERTEGNGEATNESIAVNIDELGKFLYVSPVQPDHFIVDVLTLIDGQLGEFYDPQTRLERIHQIETKITTTDDQERIEELTRQRDVFLGALKESIIQHPGQLLAVNKLLHNEDFLEAEAEYKMEFAKEPKRDHERADTRASHLVTLRGKLEDRLATQKMLIEDFVGDETNKPFIEDSRIDTHLVKDLSEIQFSSNSTETYKKSPDFILFNPGHTDDILNSIPTLFNTDSDATEIVESQHKKHMAIKVTHLAQHIHEHANEPFTDANGHSVDVLTFITGALNMELNQFYGPAARLGRLHKAVEEKDYDQITLVKNDLHNVYTQLPGQILAIDNLLSNDQFQAAVTEYEGLHKEEITTRLGEIQKLLHSHKEDLLAAQKNDADKALLESQLIPLPTAESLEQIK